MVAVHNSDDHRILLVDLSRQRMTLDTLNHLLRLSNARGIVKFIRMLAWGQNDSENPIIPRRFRTNADKHTRFVQREEKSPTSPSMHLALRAPAKRGLEMLTADGSNALVAIHEEWERIERISDSIRKGILRGVTGSVIRDVVVVGSGVPMAALSFMYTALLCDRDGLSAANEGLSELLKKRGFVAGVSTPAPVGHRRMTFLSSVDPLSAAAAVKDLDPESTMVVSIALSGHEESGMASRSLKNWLLQAMEATRRPEHIFSHHMLLVTGNDRIYGASKPESVFLIPDHSRCEPFTTFSAASLVPLSIVFGWPIVKEILFGAYDMDTHFVESNPRHNIPLLLALTDLWNDGFLHTPGRFVAPFTESLERFPAYVSTLESQVCGKPSIPGYGRKGVSSCGLPFDGGLCSSLCDRVSYQGSKAMPSELVTAMDTQATTNTNRSPSFRGLEDDLMLNQDALICSMFAHADELAFGEDGKGHDLFTDIHRTESPRPGVSSELEHSCGGNRPSSLIMCGKLDAFMCGQLIALSEHRAVLKAKLWDMDPFVYDVGASIRSSRTDKIKEELQKRSLVGASDDDDGNHHELSLSTKILLGNYADRVREQRMHVVRK
jgi:glucose-6-phosphate isomerase